VVWTTSFKLAYDEFNNTPLTHHLRFDFPNVKLGKNHYVLDLEMVDLKYSSTAFVGWSVDNCCMSTISGLGDTYLANDGGGCNVSSDTVFFLGSSVTSLDRVLSQSEGVKKRKIYERTVHGSQGHYNYGCVIPNDTLALNFTVTDEIVAKVNTALNKTDLVVEKSYHFIIRPNPSKRSYFEH